MSQASPFSHLFSGNSVEDFLTFVFVAGKLKSEPLTVLRAPFVVEPPLSKNVTLLRETRAATVPQRLLKPSCPQYLCILSGRGNQLRSTCLTSQGIFRWCPVVLQRLNNFTHVVVQAPPGSV